MHETAEKARLTIQVPWDDVRAARVHRRALDEFRRTPSEKKTEKRSLWKHARWILAAAAMVLLIGFSLSMFRSDPEPTAAMPGWGATSSLEFRDGSRSILSEQAKVQVVEDGAQRVAVLQSAGRVRYEVAPRKERRFEVTVRNVTVTVVGTIFDVGVDGDLVMVSVERGRVRVAHGARVVELGPGEHVTIDAGDAPTAALPALEDKREEKRAETSKETAKAPSEKTVTSAAELLHRADQARAAGRYDAAIASLRTLIADHPRDRRVTHALFTIGQIERQRGRHEAAAQAFEQCGSALQGDAIAEAARSWSAAGRGDRARAAAQRYLAAFPEGVHADRMRTLAE
ncbi:MAG TPA: FecR domain-containing protein [Polyangiaceae bacterium]|jgi:TolA-binding protein|nr:FecR domain-containing protein [Polyangiaceae bacterium]